MSVIPVSRPYAIEADSRCSGDAEEGCIAVTPCRTVTPPMVVLRCTQKLLARLTRPAVVSPGVSSTRLGDWYGNEWRLGRQQLLLLASGRTRLAVIVPARDARRLVTVLPEAVCDRLAALGVAAAQIERERQEMSDVVFARTDNRSVLGTMNDYAFMAKVAHARGRAPETPADLMDFFARTPIIALGGVRPMDLVRDAFGADLTAGQSHAAPVARAAGREPT